MRQRRTAWRRGTVTFTRAAAAAVAPRLPPPRSYFTPPPPASKGNKLELAGPSIFALALAAPIAVLHVYYLYLQTYVLRLDVILNAIALAFLAAEVLIGIPATLTFWRLR